MDYSLFTEKQVQQRFDSLPENLKEALNSEELRNVLLQICDDHHLHDKEKILMLEQLASMVILGFVSPEEISEEIGEHLELDSKVSTSIALDIDNMIFSRFRADMKKVYSPLLTTSKLDREEKMNSPRNFNSNDQISLKTALSYVEEVEKSLDGFSETISSETQKVRANNSWGVMGTALKGRWVIGKEKKKLLNDLDLAEDELRTAEQTSPDARLEIGEETFTIPLMKAMVYELRGKISCVAGEMKRAEDYLKTSLNHFEIPNTYYGLALVLEELKQPRKACEMYQKCIDLAANMQHNFKGTLLEADIEKTAIQARKDLQRLESKKIGNGWFVGSWKIFLPLVGLATFGLLEAVFGKNPALIPGTIIFGGLAAGYWFWKWRKQ